MTNLASPYTVTRQNGQRDIEALKALLAGDGVVDSDADVVQQIVERIEEQLPKPAIEEPREWQSMVLAGHLDAPEMPQRILVRRSDGIWESAEGLKAEWSELLDIKVLRVGIGEALPKSAAGLSRMSIEAHIRKRANEFAAEAITPPDPEEAEALARALPGQDVAPESTEDYKAGVEDYRAKMADVLRMKRSEALTAERQNAYDVMIGVNGRLQP